MSLPNMGSYLLLFLQILFFMLHALFPLLSGFQSHKQQTFLCLSRSWGILEEKKKKETDCWFSGTLNSDFPALSTAVYF